MTDSCFSMPVRKCPSSPQRPLKQHFKATVKWHAMPQVRLLPLAATTARLQENVVYSLPHVFSTFSSRRLSGSPAYGKAVFWRSDLRDTSRPTPQVGTQPEWKWWGGGSWGVGGGGGKQYKNTNTCIYANTGKQLCTHLSEPLRSSRKMTTWQDIPH